jgi:predicted nucleic acid-binding protein
MARSCLLDARVLTRLREPAVRRAIEPRAQRSELARAGIGDLEIGYSARSAGQRDRLAQALEAFEWSTARVGSSRRLG